MDNQSGQTQPASNNYTLKETLTAILTQDGLISNAEIGLNLNDRNELPI